MGITSSGRTSSGGKTMIPKSLDHAQVVCASSDKKDLISKLFDDYPVNTKSFIYYMLSLYCKENYFWWLDEIR